MSVTKRFMLLFAAFAIALTTMLPIGNSVAQAQIDDRDAMAYRESTDINRVFTKLGRGVVNLLTGWVEIPKQISREWRRTDPFTGTILGFFKGIGWGVARTFVGFYEIITFPFPVPPGYEPIMQPEFVLPTVWGERLPLYRDEFVATGGTLDPALDYGTNRPSGASMSRSY